MIKASDFITRVQGVKAKAGYIVKDSQSSSVLYFFNLSDSSVIPLSDVYIPDTGVEEPQYHGSSGGSTTSMDFYKCAAVNSDSTWSGYKAVLNQQGYYEFEQPATTGLTYNSAKITPIINQCYTDGALLAVNPYSPDIIQVDANTMFLLQGSLHDKSGHVADSSIVNNGVVINSGELTLPNNGYAQIVANALPSTVMCDGHDWTFEAKIKVTNATTVSRLGCVFGRDPSPRGDISFHWDGRFFYNLNGSSLEKSISNVLGEHIIKVTHTSSNVWTMYIDGGASNSVTVSSRNYREYDLWIGYNGWPSDPFYLSPNSIDWLRISDCIR